MTKREITGERPLDFSRWVRRRLPDSSTGYTASDLDFLLWNWQTKEVMMLEVKTRNRDMPKFQEYMFDNLQKWIAKGIPSSWTFKGFHFVKFENTNFDDGFVYLNGEVITEDELAQKLANFEP